MAIEEVLPSLLGLAPCVVDVGEVVASHRGACRFLKLKVRSAVSAATL
eukprot:CAMPEP_0114114244 /NCGR_PEP_ID=MMETSP0043_2-20121206/3334_1 /TAXON_ID=464988 /ORGANISM="Hemiselmis andersenii, Strain CCMP644" /LENGTH=47 /DNA_ID= /DNA_START= /DNA_END= /DNA_ORIENTATION=